MLVTPSTMVSECRADLMCLSSAPSTQGGFSGMGGRGSKPGMLQGTEDGGGVHIPAGVPEPLRCGTDGHGQWAW